MPASALVIVDMQNDFLAEGGAFSKRHVDALRLADTIALLVRAARAHGRVVAWVQSAYGELTGPDLKGETHVGAPCCARGSWGAEAFEPIQGLVVDAVIKRWYSAFRETTLHERLQEAGVEHVIVCGVATNVCVTMTAREALSLGYRVDVVEDATAAGTLGKHVAALKALKEAGAEIRSSGDLLAGAPVRLDGFGEGAVLHCGHLDHVIDARTLADVEREVAWSTMFHRGGEVPRLVAIQGSVDPDGAEPLYRHPVDEQPALRPWSPSVDRVRRAVEAIVGHPLNHGLLQLYRDGRDWIGSHADKTLDVVRPSSIVNVSLGSTRTMVLRPKGEGRPQRIPLPHASALVMDLETNRRWLHEIRRQGAAGEIGLRISLTFRHIGTFWQPSTGAVWGTGAKASLREEFRPLDAEGERAEATRMLALFHDENQDPEFDAAAYRPGFTALNFKTLQEA